MEFGLVPCLVAEDAAAVVLPVETVFFTQLATQLVPIPLLEISFVESGSIPRSKFLTDAVYEVGVFMGTD